MESIFPADGVLKNEKTGKIGKVKMSSEIIMKIRRKANTSL